MSTRLVRTDTIANIADFGAIENDPAAAATNAEAFRRAFASGAERIAVPAGLWYFSEIKYPNSNPGTIWTLPPNIEIFGEGRQRTFLRYVPVNDAIPAFRLHAGKDPISRSLLRDFRLLGRLDNIIKLIALGDNEDKFQSPVGTGIYALNSQHNVMQDLEIWNFQVGIDCPAAPNLFTGYTAIERFIIAGCRIGIQLRDGSNGMLISSGRILGAIQAVTNEAKTVLLGEEGVGIDIEGTNGTSGPGGASGVVLSAVQIETSPLCIRIVRSHDIAILGCYLEPGPRLPDLTTTTMRRVIEIDDLSEGIAVLGTVQSQPGPVAPTPPENFTPNYVFQVPEARGVIDLNAFGQTNPNYTNRGYGAGHHGATAAHANHIRNGDMSRGAKFWQRSGMIQVEIKEGQDDFVIGQRSLRIISTANSADHLFQDFVVDAGVRSITAVVRYAINQDPAAFRIALSTVSGIDDVTEIGHYSDTTPYAAADPLTTGWRVRALTARFDGAPEGGIQGPRRFRVQLYPFNIPAGGTAGRSVLVDSVWVVDGEYAAPYRPYQEGIEVLSGDDRTILFGGTAQTSDVGPTGFPPGFRVPANAVGMVTEMSIESVRASEITNITKLQVDDRTGTDSIRSVYAFVNNRPTITEYTIPLVPGGDPPQWQTFGAATNNALTYSVRLKAWIYRL